jgi:hypothetical protein
VDKFFLKDRKAGAGEGQRWSASTGGQTAKRSRTAAWRDGEEGISEARHGMAWPRGEGQGRGRGGMQGADAPCGGLRAQPETVRQLGAAVS